MSIKISQERAKEGVQMDVDIADTSICEDHSLSCSTTKCTLFRSLPFTFVLNGKTIEGDFYIHRQHDDDEDSDDTEDDAEDSDEIEMGLALYQIKCFSIKAELNITNLETQEKTTLKFRENFSKHNWYDTLLNIIKSGRESSSTSICAFYEHQKYISYHTASSSHLAIKGSIILEPLDFVKELNVDHVPTNKLKNFKILINEDAFANVEKNFTIVCQGQDFHFNKTLLSMVSEVFGKMIQGQLNKEATSNTVEIIDFPPETIRTFQKFAFENEEIKDDEMNYELLMFAQKYLMKPLVAICKKQLFATITHENVFDIIKMAYFIDDEDVFKKASEYLKSNSKEMKDTEDWITFEENNLGIMIKVFHYMMFGSKPQKRKLM